jgi:hypothetical protein
MLLALPLLLVVVMPLPVQVILPLLVMPLPLLLRLLVSVLVIPRLLAVSVVGKFPATLWAAVLVHSALTLTAAVYSKAPVMACLTASLQRLGASNSLHALPMVSL